MKDIYIEKCLEVVPNKFDLSLLAMNRAKSLMFGAKPTIDTTKYDKNSYVALVEIQEERVDLEELKEKVKESIKNRDIFVKNTDDRDYSLDENNSSDYADSEYVDNLSEESDDF